MGQIVSCLLALSRHCAYMGVVFLFLAMLVTVTDVLLRGVTRAANFFLEHPIGLAVPGVVDLVQFFVVAVVFLTIPFAFMTDSHVSVDLLTARLTPRREAFFRGLGALLSAIFMGAVLLHGWEQAQMLLEFGDSSSTLEIPMFYYWVFLLLGAGLSVAATILIAIGQIGIAVGGSSTTGDSIRHAEKG